MHCITITASLLCYCFLIFILLMLTFEWCETDTFKQDIDKCILNDFQFFTKHKHHTWSLWIINKQDTLEIFLCSEDYYT